jgi:hypothetical protein
MSTLKRGELAHRLSAFLAIASAGCFGYGFLILFSEEGSDLAIPFFVAGGVNVIAGIIFGHVAILRITGAAGERILFETFFPLGMSLVPVGGPIIALLSAIKLLRGKLGSATITSSSGSSHSVSHYDAMKLGKAGVPAGLCLLVVVCLQPLFGYYLYKTETEPAKPSSPPAAEKRNPEPVSRQEKLERYSRGACDGMIACYTRADHVGQLAGRVIMKVGDNGEVRSVEIKSPQTREAILKCIRRVAMKKHIPDFEGPMGNLVCEYAGSMAGKTSSVNTNEDFLPAK